VPVWAEALAARRMRGRVRLFSMRAKSFCGAMRLGMSSVFHTWRLGWMRSVKA
jgi:hypothetical protein